MNFTDEQVRDILDLKEKTIAKIERYYKEIEALQKQVDIWDVIVKQSSFTKASSLPKDDSFSDSITSEPEGQRRSTDRSADHDEQSSEQPVEQSSEQPAEQPADPNTTPIRRGSDGEVIANAHVTDEQITITLDDSLSVQEDTPPLKSFFLDRIIGEMKKKDETESIPDEESISYNITKDGENIRQIIIKNYRQEPRVKEIINSASWSLTRMLDNTG